MLTHIRQEEDALGMVSNVAKNGRVEPFGEGRQWASLHEKILSHSFTPCACRQAEVVASHYRSGRPAGLPQRIRDQQRGLGH